MNSRYCFEDSSGGTKRQESYLLQAVFDWNLLGWMQGGLAERKSGGIRGQLSQPHVKGEGKGAWIKIMAVYFKVTEKQERKKQHIRASKLQKLRRLAAKRMTG